MGYTAWEVLACIAVPDEAAMQDEAILEKLKTQLLQLSEEEAAAELDRLMAEDLPEEPEADDDLGTHNLGQEQPQQSRSVPDLRY